MYAHQKHFKIVYSLSANATFLTTKKLLMTNFRENDSNYFYMIE